MKIALRCEKCRNIYMAAEDELRVEFDFYEKIISFVCPQCKHLSTMDVKNWKQQQQHSPLPRIAIT